MEINWLIIILSFVAITAVITFLIIQNQKDEKALIRKSEEGEKGSIQEEEHNAEIDP
jgi:preprotein translocase subunit YajC